MIIPAGCDKPGIAGRKPAKIFGGKGLGPGQFVYPRAIAVGPQGCVFIVDKTARIQRFGVPPPLMQRGLRSDRTRSWRLVSAEAYAARRRAGIVLLEMIRPGLGHRAGKWA